MKWLAQSTIYRDSVDLVAVLDPYGDGRAVAQPVNFEMKQQGRHELISEPTLALSHNSAQSLLQALWDAGMRPADWNRSGPIEVQALRSHIAFAERVADGLLGQLGKTEGTK
jgi:hypothetical protein